MRDWIAFWNTANSIYVNARHKDVHYRTIANDLIAYVPGPSARVLDYGCGEALHADRIAHAAGELVLTDAAPAVRAQLAQRHAGVTNLRVAAPEAVEAMDGTFDLIVMNSVAQYLGRDELDRLLRVFRRLLRPHGQFVLGDVIPPSTSALVDAAALLRFGSNEGFLSAAILGLARTVFSDYRKLRAQIGLTFYEETAMLEKLGSVGFSARRAVHNIGHNQARMTFVAT